MFKFFGLRKHSSARREPPAILAIFHSAKLQGAPKSAFDVIAALAKTSRVVVVCQSEGPILDRLRELAIECHVMRMPMWLCDRNASAIVTLKRSVVLLLRTLFALVKLGWMFRAGPPILIYTNTVIHPIGAIYAAICGIPHVWHIREPVAEYGWKFLAFEDKCVNFIKYSSRFVIFNSNYTRDCYFNSHSMENTIVVYNGIAGPQEPTVGLRRGDRTHLRIGVIGELCHRKGQDLVLDAIAEAPVLEGLEIFFGGEGSADFKKELAEKARQLPAGNVHLLGVVETWDFLSRVDLLIVPSRMEAFGRVVVEGMLAGIPVLAASTGGITEVIDDGRTGFLFEASSARSLREQLNAVIDRGDLDEVAATALEVANDKFASERYIIETLEVLEAAQLGVVRR